MTSLAHDSRRRRQRKARPWASCYRSRRFHRANLARPSPAMTQHAPRHAPLRAWGISPAASGPASRDSGCTACHADFAPGLVKPTGQPQSAPDSRERTASARERPALMRSCTGGLSGCPPRHSAINLLEPALQSVQGAPRFSQVVVVTQFCDYRSYNRLRCN